MPQVLAPLKFQDGSAQQAAVQTALMLGFAGTIPAAAAADTADFPVLVPFDLTATRMKVVAKVAPTVNTTVQVRRSTDSGATYADLTGFSAVLLANTRVITADPADVSLTEGDALQFSVTGGGGSGSNLLVELIGTIR